MDRARERLIVAVDVDDGHLALRLVRSLAAEVRYFKVGLELGLAAGPRILEHIYGEGGRVFLDWKLHDIPSMVAAAARIAAGHGVGMLSVHCAGGLKMMQVAKQAAAERAQSLGIPRPLVLGLTLLTSIDEYPLRRELGLGDDVPARVTRLARLAQQAGLDGCVASPREVEAVRQACGGDFTVVTPGIRPDWSAHRDDQRRVLTPAAALAAGADYLVVGRPITQAPDPLAAARRILTEMEAAL